MSFVSWLRCECCSVRNSSLLSWFAEWIINAPMSYLLFKSWCLFISYKLIRDKSLAKMFILKITHFGGEKSWYCTFCSWVCVNFLKTNVNFCLSASHLINICFFAINRWCCQWNFCKVGRNLYDIKYIHI